MMLVNLRCTLWKWTGNIAMLLAVPFWAMDTAATWFAEAFGKFCAWCVIPHVLVYDFCVKRHNELRRRAQEPER